MNVSRFQHLPLLAVPVLFTCNLDYFGNHLLCDPSCHRKSIHLVGEKMNGIYAKNHINCDFEVEVFKNRIFIFLLYSSHIFLIKASCAPRLLLLVRPLNYIQSVDEPIIGFNNQLSKCLWFRKMIYPTLFRSKSGPW